MNKILVLAVFLLLSTLMVSAEVQEVDVNYFGEIMKLTKPCEELTYVDWSPDGTKIVNSEWYSGLNIWNISDGTLIMKLKGHTDAVWTAKWSPDGTKIASASWDKTVRVWDSMTGEELAVYNHTNQVWGLEWSPDGTKILSGADNGKITLWDVSTGNPIMNITNNANEIMAIEWSPDGTMIAGVSMGDKVIILNASTFEIFRIYYLNAYDISWSPDSSSIAAGGHGSMNFTIIDVLEGNQKDVIYPYGDTGNNGTWGISWSPDGTKIATAMSNSNIYIWDVNGILIKTLTGHEWWVETVSWSPDGTKLASGSDDQTIKIWGDLRD